MTGVGVRLSTFRRRWLPLHRASAAGRRRAPSLGLTLERNLSHLKWSCFMSGGKEKK